MSGMTLTTPVGTAVRCDDGIASALDEAARLGCDATQIMFRPPQSYVRRTPLPAADVATLTAIVEQGGMVTACHASVWCTLSRPDTDPKQKMSNATIAEDLRLCEDHGVLGTVVHPGSWTTHLQGEFVARNVLQSLRRAGSATRTARLLIENSASKKALHASLFAIADSLAAADPHDQRTGICLDTAHAWGAGLDLSDPETVAVEIAPFANRIRLVHFNNSRHALGSGRDGHGRLGEGTLSWDQLERTFNLLRETLSPGTPFIIESTDLQDEIATVSRWGQA
jgi:deoxyribonuclease IV